MKKSLLFVFLFSVMFFGVCAFFPNWAYADTVPYFTFQMDTESAPPNGLVKVRINANPTLDTAAAFRMKIDYDASALSFVRTETSSQIKTGTLMTNSVSNPICSVYVCNVDQKSAPILSGNVITFVFKVCDAAQAGKTVIGAHIDQICNYQAQQLNLNYDENLLLKIDPEQTLSGNAYLTSLKPLNGLLTPAFSSDVFEYKMTVGHEVSSVEFEAAAGDGGTVTINRRTLGKAGSDTLILATVSSKNKKAKVQYAVTVQREALPAAGSEAGAESSAGSVIGNLEETKADQHKKTAGRSGSTKGDAAPQAESVPVQAAAEGGIAGQPTLSVNGSGTGSTRNIYIIGNQMPAYVVILLAVVVLVQLGVILAPWLNARTVGKVRTAEENPDKKDQT